jgi:AAA15 family ATPase/GTPase
MSFKERATLSLIPGAGEELPKNVARHDKFRVLKSAVVFGANASGKTNIVKAFSAAIMMIRESENIQLGNQLPRMVSFKLDKSRIDKPSSFEFIFEENGTKYIYGFSATVKQIAEEYLYAYYSVKPTTIFERENDNYEFKADKKNLEELAAKNNPNRLFLATLAAWNYERAKEPFLWFAKQIDTYAGNNWIQDIQAFISDTDGAQKSFTKRLLEIADINISDYDMQEIDIPKEQIDAMLRDPFLKVFVENTLDFSKPKAVSFKAIHPMTEGEKEVLYALDLVEESAGTQHLFFMSTHLKKAFESGRTMVVDELDAGLHPLLLEELVRMFHDPEINTGDAQLIFTTHAVGLLDLDLFRRDQIFFTEKTRDTASSELFALDEFSVRKAENIRNGYIYGRYGAIPNIKSGASPWV